MRSSHIILSKTPADLTTNILILALLVYLAAFPKPLKESITSLAGQSTFLYLFMGTIIAGSILGMDRNMPTLALALFARVGG